MFVVRCGNDRDVAAADTPELEVRGTVANVRSAIAIASVDGRIARVNVQEGAVVKAGDVVAALVNPAVDRDLAFARAQVAVAERRLAEARKPVRSQLADNGERVLLAAEILANRKARRDRYRELFKTHDVSREELENAENEHAAALRDWLAERERASATVVQTDTGILELELEKARAEEAFAAERKSQLDVKAPIGGTVTRVAARAGESVFPRDPVLEIADTSSVEVRGPIAPELLRYVRTGMPVEVKIFTVPPRRFRVPIRSIVPGNEGATLLVTLPNPDGVLQPGQTAVITVK
jgi:multidrug resistance efflux pump